MSFKAFITKTTARAKSGVNRVSVAMKLNSQKSSLNEELEGMFDTLGKITYYSAIGERNENTENDITDIIAEISRLRAEIELIEEQLRDIGGKKQCSKCHADLQKDISFCPYCGEKLSVDSSSEEEVTCESDIKTFDDDESLTQE